MELQFCKGELRRARYLKRARKARSQARFVTFLLVLAAAGSVWMDEALNKDLRAYAMTQIERFEDATKDSQSKANTVVAMMMAKINPY